jgi:hypothetical protein
LYIENCSSERLEKLKLKLRQRWRRLKTLRPGRNSNVQNRKAEYTDVSNGQPEGDAVKSIVGRSLI